MNALKATQNLLRSDFVTAQGTDGDSIAFNLHIPPNTKKAKFTLVWNDPPATANAFRAIVNDLDLELQLPSTAQILGISEKKVMDMIEAGQLQAYRIADQFLRLKRNEIMEMRSSGQIVSENIRHDYTTAEKVRDFFYFNDFYLLALIVISVLLYIIFFTNS